MSLTLDEFWAAYHEASNCAGKSVQICRSAESAGSLLRVLDEVTPEELERAYRTIEAVGPLLVAALPEPASFGRVMAASWHLAAWQCLRDVLRDVLKAIGVPPEQSWFTGEIGEETRNRGLLTVGHRAGEIRDVLSRRYGELERQLRRTRYMLYKEVVGGWRLYRWECAIGVRSESPPAFDPAALATSHGPDYRSVVWNSKPFSFTPQQAEAVHVLWDAWTREKPDVAEESLLEQVSGEFATLCEVFRDHKAWGTMVVAGRAEGTYRLNGPA